MSKSHQLVAFLFGLFFSASVFAQTTSFEAMMNGIIKSTPGVTNIAVGTGVRTSVAGSVAVAADGLTIPVATTIAADIPYAAVAAGAGRVALRAVPWVGTAIALAEVGNILASSGFKSCPPPDFWCKTSAPVGSTYVPTVMKFRYCTGNAGACATWHDDVGSACADLAAFNSTRYQSDGKTLLPWSVQSIQTVAPFICVIYTPGNKSNANPNGYDPGTFSSGAATQLYCNDSTLAVNGLCTVTTPGTDGPATLEDVNKALANKINADHDWGVKMKNQMDAIAQANPAMEPPVNVKTAPLVLTAPAVTTQPQTISTRTIPNADGSTSTETVTKATTVTATQGSPSTVENPNITYNPKTTTTTTTVNNTTNVTTTNTTTVNNSPVTVTSPQQKLDLPTDYNREATQQKILNVLNGEGMPTAALKSADPSIEQISAQNKVGLTTVDQVTDSGVGITNWFPKIATAQCRNPQVPNPITGNKVDVVICDKVDLFSAFVSGVIAVYCLFGCVREVTAAIKA